MERSTDFTDPTDFTDFDDSTNDARRRTRRRKMHHMYNEHDDHDHSWGRGDGPSRGRGGRHRGDHDRGPRGGGGGHRGGGGGGGGRHRARRGALVAAVLTLLDERPMHGYELITELEDRSEGRWRPSPGAMYPALKKMVANGLLTSEEVDGKRQFSLSEAGRERLAAMQEQRGDDAGAPWDETGTGRRGELRSNIAELIGQARQIGRFGTPEQIEQARTVLDDAKRQLYGILATTPDTDTDNAVDAGSDASTD